MARVTGVGRGLLFLMGWATGCRSERVAFACQPVITQAVIPTPDTVLLGKAGFASRAVGCLSSNKPVVCTFQLAKHKPSRKPFDINITAQGKQLSSRCKPQNLLPASTRIKARRSIDDSQWGSIIFLGGGVICVTAVIVGISIGGILGLGVGSLLYLTGAYLIARGFAGPFKSSSPSSYFGPTPVRSNSATTRNMHLPKLPHRPASTASLGEITFTVGSLMVIVSLILGLTGVLSGNAALLLGVVSLFLAGAAYGGIKPPKKT